MQRVLSVFRPKKPTVHAVHLSGVISSRAGPRGISFQNVKPQLEAAFKVDRPLFAAVRKMNFPFPLTPPRHPHTYDQGTPEAVALVVNSPGGSPTQCSLIGDLVDSLQAKTKVPVISFSEDLAASGGYWSVTCACECTAYCNPFLYYHVNHIRQATVRRPGGVLRQVVDRGLHRSRERQLRSPQPNRALWH